MAGSAEFDSKPSSLGCYIRILRWREGSSRGRTESPSLKIQPGLVRMGQSRPGLGFQLDPHPRILAGVGVERGGWAGTLGSTWDPAFLPISPCLPGRGSAPLWASAVTSCPCPHPPAFFKSLSGSLSLVAPIIHLHIREARGGRGLGYQEYMSLAVSDQPWVPRGHLRV